MLDVLALLPHDSVYIQCRRGWTVRGDESWDQDGDGRERIGDS